MDRVALIREHVPDCAITTDIIVGFPGETEEDFEQTLDVVDEVGYDGAFTFIFSPRRGTEAAEFDDQLSHAVKRARMERLVELVQRRARERAERFLGRTMEVLVEGPSRTDPSRLRGRTRHSKTVNFDGTAAPGELVEVEITRRDLDHPERTERPEPRCCGRGGVRILALFGPTAVGKTGVAIAVAERAARPGRGPGRGQLRLDPGLPRPRDAERRGERRRAGPPRASAALVRRSGRGVQRGPLCRGGTSRDRLAARAGAPSDRRGRNRPLSAGGARGSGSASARPDGDPRAGGGRDRRARPAGAARRARPGAGRERRSERPQTGRPPDRAGAGGNRCRCGRRGHVDRRAAASDPAGGPDDGTRAAGEANRRPGGRDGREGAAEEARAAEETGASRTARAALGYEQLVSDIDGAPSAEAIESMKAAHRRYARRQLTWMRRMESVTLIDRTDRDDGGVAAEIVRAPRARLRAGGIG